MELANLRCPSRTGGRSSLPFIPRIILLTTKQSVARIYLKQGLRNILGNQGRELSRPQIIKYNRLLSYINFFSSIMLQKEEAKRILGLMRKYLLFTPPWPAVLPKKEPVLSNITQTKIFFSFVAEISAFKADLASRVAELIRQIPQSNINEEVLFLLKKVSSCLKILLEEPKTLLTGQILEFYVALIEIEKRNNSTWPCLGIFLKHGLSCRTLLNFSFLYENCQNELNSACENSSDSQQEQSQPALLPPAPLSYEEMINLPQIQLIQTIIRQQENKLNLAQEKCRICSNFVKFRVLEKHVKTCQRKFEAKQKLCQITQQSKALLNQAKNIFNTLIGVSQKSQAEEKFTNILKLILSPKIAKSRKMLPRMTHLGAVNDVQDLYRKAEALIQEYFCNYGKELFLQEFNQIQKQMFRLQKLIASTELSDYFEEAADLPISQIPECIQAIKSPKNGENKKDFRAKKDAKRSSIQGCFAEKLASVTEDEVKSDEKKSLVELLCQDNIKSLTPSASSSSLNTKSSNSSLKTQSSYRIAPFRFHKKGRSKKNIEDGNLARKYYSLKFLEKNEPEHKILINHFHILKFIGAGAFGKVYLVRRKETQDIYALKIVPMSPLAENELINIRNEHEIFKKIAGDHLVKALFSFSEKNSHVFILEYLPGGDLSKILEEKVYFDERQAQFYLAEIVLAIEHLHKFGVIHRDLKPDNLVLDKYGHLKLTDFGLSEIQIKNKLQKAMSLTSEGLARKGKRRVAIGGRAQKIKIIGTPDYIAPQIINELSTSNFTIDWWSLGVIAYELLVGVRPFCGETVEEVINNITSFSIQWPEIGEEEGMISAESQDLIQKLLNMDFTNRLGAKGAWEIKKHPFFKNIEWETLKLSTAPFLPDMNKIKALAKSQEDPQLSKQIEEILGKRHGNRSIQGEFFKLQQFVRFDILGIQTLENAVRIRTEGEQRIRLLKIARESL